jgi:hypothetical protein
MRGINDIIKRMNSGIDVDFDNECIADLFSLYEKFVRLNGDPNMIEKIKNKVIEKYLQIPEDERRYCLGDMDSKDHGIKFLMRS